MVSILNKHVFGPKGYLRTEDPDPTKSKGQKRIVENDTLTCGHLGEIIKVRPMCPPEEMPYTMCYGCRRFICIKCAEEMDRIGKCVTLEARLEAQEARGRLYEAARGG